MASAALTHSIKSFYLAPCTQHCNKEQAVGEINIKKKISGRCENRAAKAFQKVPNQTIERSNQVCINILFLKLNTHNIKFHKINRNVPKISIPRYALIQIKKLCPNQEYGDPWGYANTLQGVLGKI